MGEPFSLEREGTRLAGIVAGEGTPPVLLLHGLAGCSGEWAETIGWLGEARRVVAFDARGHGRSERAPDDVSRAAHVADAIHVIERLDLGPAVVIGQSLGGITAMLLAAARPDLVAGLIVVEAMPLLPDDEGVRRAADWLAGWPVPFADRAAAVEFFGGPSSWADAWAAGLEVTEDGLRPRFDPEVMVRTLTADSERELWTEWGAIACPTLIVRGENGSLPEEAARRMVDSVTDAELVMIPGAGHDLHLEDPGRWRVAVEEFISRGRVR